MDPSPNPDGKRLVYISVTAGKEQLFTMNADTSESLQITHDDADHEDPAWSPWSADSKRLIYCTDDDLQPLHKNDSDIDVADLSTGIITTLITGGVNTYPAWSPDMKHIAFRRMVGEMNSEVFIADADGGNARNLTNHPAFDGWAAWSPDGKLIAFASNRNARYQIFIMKPDGTDVHLVANTEGRATVPRWSPDGKTLYFTNCVSKDYGTDCEILVSKLPI